MIYEPTCSRKSFFMNGEHLKKCNISFRIINNTFPSTCKCFFIFFQLSCDNLKPFILRVENCFDQYTIRSPGTVCPIWTCLNKITNVTKTVRKLGDCSSRRLVICDNHFFWLTTMLALLALKNIQWYSKFLAPWRQRAR